MKYKTEFMILVLVLCVATVLVCKWQIEEVWRSFQNGWVYNLPFLFSTPNYWLAHDFLWTVESIANAVLVVFAVRGVYLQCEKDLKKRIVDYINKPKLEYRD